MIEPTASEIVSILGNALFEHDDTPLGVDEEKDRKALEGSLKYFIAAWLAEKLAVQCAQKPEGEPSRFSYTDYTDMIEQLSKENSRLFRIRERSDEYMVLEMTSVSVLVDLNRLEDNGCVVSILIEPHRNNYYGGEYDMTPTMLADTIRSMEDTIRERCSVVLESGLALCLPPDLRPYFKRAKFTKDMGHSTWSSGEFLYGHETRLRLSAKHDFALAYTPDNFSDTRLFEDVFNNAVRAYGMLRSISDLLPPDVSFQCVHADDMGVSFTDEGDFPEHYWDICHAMDHITEYLEYGELQELEDYEYILRTNQLIGVMTAEELKEKFDLGNTKRQKKAKEIGGMLPEYQSRIAISADWHCIHLYTTSVLRKRMLPHHPL